MNAKDTKLFGETQQLIVVVGDLSGGFHLLKLSVWEDIAQEVCVGNRKKFLPQILKNLREADKARR